MQGRPSDGRESRGNGTNTTLFLSRTFEARRRSSSFCLSLARSLSIYPSLSALGRVFDSLWTLGDSRPLRHQVGSASNECLGPVVSRHLQEVTCPFAVMYFYMYNGWRTTGAWTMHKWWLIESSGKDERQKIMQKDTHTTTAAAAAAVPPAASLEA